MRAISSQHPTPRLIHNQRLFFLKTINSVRIFLDRPKLFYTYYQKSQQLELKTICRYAKLYGRLSQEAVVALHGGKYLDIDKEIDINYKNSFRTDRRARPWICRCRRRGAETSRTISQGDGGNHRLDQRGSRSLPDGRQYE